MTNRDIAQLCYDERPCNFRDTEDQTVREFSKRLLETRLAAPTKNQIEWMVKIIQHNEA